MKVFKLGRDLEIICQSEKTRYGFRHLATLQTATGHEYYQAKCCYYNRTWECYEFESVLKKLLDVAIKEKLLKSYYISRFKKFLKTRWAKPNDFIKMVARVALMGEVLAGDSQKAKNDWKARMLKAGLENKGLIMPDNWDSLSEDTKTARLDKIISFLNK